jgi:hypothetical protein
MPLKKVKKKKIKFSFLGTLQKIIDLYRPSDQTSPLKTYIRRSKTKKPIEEVPEQTAVDGVEISSDTVSQDEVNVVRTLRDLHESMNEVEEQGGMDHYMETCNDDICVTLETIIDRIPPKMALLEYNVPVMGLILPLQVQM